MVPQGSPVGKEVAVAVDMTLVFVELAVGLGTFVGRSLGLHRGLGQNMRVTKLSRLVRHWSHVVRHVTCVGLHRTLARVCRVLKIVEKQTNTTWEKRRQYQGLRFPQNTHRNR